MLSLNLSKPNIGNLNISISKNQYTFEYPCQTSDICTPYTIVLDRGIYKFETWGSSGSGNGIAGLGGYTSGIIHLSNVQTFYLFVGSRTNFNYKTNKGEYYSYGGASSDVRLYVNENIDWFNDLSLRSRIMVSGGGGSAEWPGSIGGNSGGLTGSDGFSDCRYNGVICPEIWAKGANQTNGGTASRPNKFNEGNQQRDKSSFDGIFGRIPIYNDKINIGGMGGNGYYSGATLEYAGGGSGGSSFISGHKGCIALNSSLNEFPNPYNSSIHYSGLYFTQTQMISGNETMPLYSSSNSKGIGNKNEGCIRITILTKDCSCICNSYLHMNSFIYNFIFICIDSE
ncbi:hypothetical protein TVAG_599450 [Trichomonas vaginalis G3]|uniref:receptor protein-tyrosine kinase n=1 Tax=Trichomonas vaginalis (strain ATCC PRA-98 / G3) TaxID=412133 RepID=A2GFA1_TRIV3|nr:hypothetical protein TVAG_599450 [Trichomonas vaginalis G3]|eukprot:XP_001297098.1 hypothetical protein [Trichomonas vaginalis G3]